MQNIDKQFIRKDSCEYQQKVLEQRYYKSDIERKQFIKANRVRQLELLQLNYFNPIQHVIVDPMHCIFLGIAKWIVKRIQIDEGILTLNILTKVQSMMNRIRVPSDIGRIRGKLDCGEGFSNFTAYQWQNFIIIYATVVLWEHLSDVDRQILTHFVKICQILVCQIMQLNLLNEAHKRLIKLIKLIERKYRPEKLL